MPNINIYFLAYIRLAISPHLPHIFQLKMWVFIILMPWSLVIPLFIHSLIHHSLNSYWVSGTGPVVKTQGIEMFVLKNILVGGASRWRRSKKWRSPSSPQRHQIYIYMWNNSYRTYIECWQKTTDFPKGKKLPTYLGRVKVKRKIRDKRIGMGPAPVGGSCEGGKVSTH